MTSRLPAPAPAPPRLIAREMAAGFAAVSLVAMAAFILLLTLLQQVSGLVVGMREEESAIRQGLGLATAVREQYVHIARALVEGDHTLPSDDAAWGGRVQMGIDALRPHVPAEERWRLVALDEKTRALATRFSTSTLPAVARGERVEIVAEQRALAALAGEASVQADALAHAVESRMAHSHVLATRATQLGLLAGGAGAIVVVALSLGFTVRLRRAVFKPLTLLSDAARRFGAGDFSTRVGAVGKGELLALSLAFDRMAEELAERQRRLVDHERMAAIGHLAAGVAHELNNPIGIIRGYLKTMGAKDDPATLEEELQILDEEAAQCQRIAEDLLAYARPLALKMETVDIKPFIEETLRRLQASPAASTARIEVDVGAFELSADPTRLRQVVLNLVQNAIQVSPNGAPVSIVGRVDEDSDAYVVAVIDEGPGVPLADRGRIFEPFFTTRKGGSGLGLSVCQGIVRAHGGTIAVDSRGEGRGSVFRVSLPARALEASDGGAA